MVVVEAMVGWWWLCHDRMRARIRSWGWRAHLEVFEQDDEDEQVVDREGLLHQVPGHREMRSMICESRVCLDRSNNQLACSLITRVQKQEQQHHATTTKHARTHARTYPE